MRNEENLRQILASLGDSAQAVAVTLKTNGVRGVKNTVRYLNPIVRYAQNQLRIDDFGLDLMQRDGRQVYTLRLSLPDGHMREADLPVPVREFLESFNRGEHPDLELPHDSI